MLPLIILPVAFLILSFSVMLSTWWVSFILKTTGQPYMLHFPLDPLSIFAPSICMHCHPPNKTIQQILHPFDFLPNPMVHPPPIKPLSPPPTESPASLPTNVPTFTKQHDLQILDELIDTLGPSYLASSYPPSAFTDHLSFYATSELDNYIINDTSVTSSLSYNIDDFEPESYRKLDDTTVHGIRGMPITITGIGFVNWTVRDSKGDQITLRAPATHIPSLMFASSVPNDFSRLAKNARTMRTSLPTTTTGVSHGSTKTFKSSANIRKAFPSLPYFCHTIPK